ncbi:hypothetical protein, partial [Legionella bononiensis]|uniref:hypothetical protein n=1 Tax=Legionella bononiensis TaxID=2793102 RepID=UPI0019314159
MTVVWLQPSYVILNEVKDLQTLAQCQSQEIPRFSRDDGCFAIAQLRHPERSEGSPNAGTMPKSGDPSLLSG